MHTKAEVAMVGNPGPIPESIFRHVAEQSRTVTDADRREAIRDPEIPQAVKRVLKNHLFGRVDGRREVSSELRRSAGYRFTDVPSGARRRSGKLKPPEGMSARQFKRMRKEALRELNASKS